jgi:GrpB-like predicted nucleotidyltransferase (UPF0157 family)
MSGSGRRGRETSLRCALSLTLRCGRGVRGDVPRAIQRLAAVGYRHEGDLGIAGREAFIAPEHLPPHHLYVCVVNGRELRRHLAFRDYLRSHPDQAMLYANLKHELAERCGDNRTAYTDGKSEFIQSRLASAGWHP